MEPKDPAELLETLFPPTAGPVTPAPFPQAKQKKREVLYDKTWVRQAIAAQSNGDVELVDPSKLSATQYGVTRPGVAYYLTDTYWLTGETYADMEKLSNRFPLIYIKETGESLILAGHHRSTAALLKSEPLLAIVVRVPWSGSRPSARLVTPSLVVGAVAEDDNVTAEAVADVDGAVSLIRAGRRAGVPTAELARQVLVGVRGGDG